MRQNEELSQTLVLASSPEPETTVLISSLVPLKDPELSFGLLVGLILIAGDQKLCSGDAGCSPGFNEVPDIFFQSSIQPGLLLASKQGEGRIYLFFILSPTVSLFFFFFFVPFLS